MAGRRIFLYFDSCPSEPKLGVRPYRSSFSTIDMNIHNCTGNGIKQYIVLDQCHNSTASTVSVRLRHLLKHSLIHRILSILYISWIKSHKLIRTNQLFNRSKSINTVVPWRVSCCVYVCVQHKLQYNADVNTLFIWQDFWHNRRHLRVD